MDTFTAIRAQALALALASQRADEAVRRGRPPKVDPRLDDYEVRQLLREYSTTFVTPLHEVYELPLEWVLQQVWEHRYSEMGARDTDEKDPDQRTYLERERDLLAETEAEREEKARLAREAAAADEAYHKQVAREAAAQKAADEEERARLEEVRRLEELLDKTQGLRSVFRLGEPAAPAPDRAR